MAGKRPARGALRRRPSSPWTTNRCRQRLTVAGVTPSSCAMTRSVRPSAARRTMRARIRRRGGATGSSRHSLSVSRSRSKGATRGARLTKDPEPSESSCVFQWSSSTPCDGVGWRSNRRPAWVRAVQFTEQSGPRADAGGSQCQFSTFPGARRKSEAFLDWNARRYSTGARFAADFHRLNRR